MANSSEVKKIFTNLSLIALFGIAAQFIIISHSFSSEGFDLLMMIKATEIFAIVSLRVLAIVSIVFIVIGVVQWMLVNTLDTLIIGFKTCVAGLTLTLIVLKLCLDLPNSIVNPLLFVNCLTIVGTLALLPLMRIIKINFKSKSQEPRAEESSQ